jgi:hypothetical protein
MTLSKHPFRFRRKAKQRTIAPEYPTSLPPAHDLCQQVQFVGSAEHKEYPSFAGPPARRADATPCPPEWGTNQSRFQDALERAIQQECVSEEVEGEFPRYVWGVVEETLCVARLVNRDQGWDKGWPLDPGEAPNDPANKLNTVPGWEV